MNMTTPTTRSAAGRRSPLRRFTGIAAAVVVAIVLAGCGSSVALGGGALGNAPPASAHVGHIFLIVLENKGYSTTFGSNPPAPYLARTLTTDGALLQDYYATGHLSLDNYISMISGQGPNPQTQSDCQNYTNFTGTGTLDANGQATGSGCVYPTSVPMLGDQLEAAGLSWKEYAEDLGSDPARESACGVPATNALGQDQSQTASATDQYAARHNPFVYFHSVTDNAQRCTTHSVNLKQLPTDLASVATTPNFTFITPDLCSDGHDATCANTSQSGGYAGIQAFLSNWVPIIMTSPAFKQNGLLLVTFDESDGPQTDSSACCGEGPTPNTALPGINGLGGGLIGLVAVSPFIKPGTVSATAYNHYSMLRTIEDLLGLKYLGYAGASGQMSFGSDVFTRQMPLFPPKH